MPEPTPMPLPGPLLEARFLQRPNRFLAQVQLGSKTVWAHVPDPGRLHELLLPQAQVLLRENHSRQRKTRYSMVMVRQGETLISIDSQLPNRFLRHCFDQQLIPDWLGWEVLRQEVTQGRSRFDFLLGRGRSEMLVEVKSATLVEEGIARFPDAVTARGARHVRHLAELKREGKNTAVFFLIQREDARAFEPHWERDPVFAEELQKAVAAGVELKVYTSRLSPGWMSLGEEVPVNLEAHR